MKDEILYLAVKVAAQIHFGLQRLSWHQLCCLDGLDGIPQGKKLRLLFIYLVSLLKTFPKISAQPFIEEGLVPVHLVRGVLLSHCKAQQFDDSAEEI